MRHLIGYLLFISILLLGIFFKSGFELNVAGLSIWGVFSALIAIPFYFESQKGKTPTRFEHSLASTWLVARRIICFTGSIVCLAILVFASGQDHPNIAVQVLFLAFAIMFLWVGIYGAGESRGFQDDVYFHELRKKRYDVNQPNPSVKRD